MDESTVTRVIDFVESVVHEIKQTKVSITLHGGEPLTAGYEVIHNLISGFNDRFNRIDLDIGIQSNLWLLDKKYCELFKKYNVNVGTSLDGPQKINDEQRGEGSFYKTLRGINLARSYGLNVGCIATFTSKSMKHWKTIFDFFLENNLHFSIHPAISPVSGETALEISPQQYSDLLENMFDYYVINRKKIKVAAFDQICQSIATNQGKVCTFRDCFGMFLAIDPKGDIYSCQRFAGKTEFRLGNIKKKPSLTDIVDSTMAKLLLDREKKIKTVCGDCEHIAYCKGGCAYNALNRVDEDTRDPLCEGYKKIFLHLKKRLYEDVVSNENSKALIELGPTEFGNPLLRRGPVIELTKENFHPYDTARTAKRIIAAYELAKNPDINTTAQRLVEMGISRTFDSALTSLTSMQKNMKSTSKLNKLYIHVTWSCQLHCSHCYASAGNNTKQNEMKTRSIMKLVREAAKCGFKEAIITGGEPLLLSQRKSFLTSIANLKDELNPMRLVLRTNFAMPLSKEEYKLLAAAFDTIVVSIDGNKESHDLRRGTGTYEKAVRNIEGYCSVIKKSPENIAKVSARISLAASIKAEKAKGEFGNSVKKLARRFDITYKFRPLLPLGNAINMKESINPEPLRAYLKPIELIEQGFNPVMTCGIGQNLYVEPSGDCFPCYSYHKPHSFLGNVTKKGLQTIVESEPFKSLQLHTVDTNCKCKLCEYRYLCGGACRAWSGEAVQYDLDKAPIGCEGLRNRAEQIYREALNYLGLFS